MTTARDSYLKRTYGITERLFNRQLKRQGGGCIGCGQQGKTKALNVDHEHVPGWKRMLPKDKKKYNRMIVCHRCNRVIGMAWNQPQTLRNLADALDDYLKNGTPFK